MHSREDRRNLNYMNGIPERNRRDASGTSSTSGLAPRSAPVSIFPGQSRTSNGDYGNPYTRSSLKSNLHEPRGSSSLHPGSRALPAPPYQVHANKRQKLDDSFDHDRRPFTGHDWKINAMPGSYDVGPSTSGRSPRASSKAATSSFRADEPIVVDDDDEDEDDEDGQPPRSARPSRASSSSDGILLFPEAGPSRRERSLPPLVDHDDDLAADGPSTSRLKASHTHRGRSPSEDPIEQYDVDPPLVSAGASGANPFLKSRHSSPGRRAIPNQVVNMRVGELESLRNPTPHIDLRNLAVGVSRKGVQSRMQPAASSSGVRKDIIATSTTNYTTIKAPRSKAHASPPDTFVALPIEDGYMGTHRLLSESDFKDYWLCWDRTKSLLSISDSRPVNSKPNFIWQCNKTGWQTMEYCDASPDYMLCLTTKRFGPATAAKHHIKGFIQGSSDLGVITLKFKHRHPNMTEFTTVVAGLKQHIKAQSMVTSNAVKSVWEMAQNTTPRQPTDAEGSREHTLRPRVKKPQQYASPAKAGDDSPPPAARSRRARAEDGTADDGSDARRSTRISAAAAAAERLQGPIPGDDELILVYPPTGTGSFHLTRGDRRRLGPSEFLNDTLIEFALKLWLDELRATKPELADQIHVFNSFFYKKLNVANVTDGYASVRKWTSKFDLFGKKYIVVPINENLHWYLAIICEPEHVLQPPPPQIPPAVKVTTRQQKRKLGGDAPSSRDASPAEVEMSSPLSEAPDLPGQPMLADVLETPDVEVGSEASGAEVEGLLGSESRSQAGGSRTATPLPDYVDEDSPMREVSPAGSPPLEVVEPRSKAKSAGAGPLDPLNGLQAASFYAANTGKGKQKAVDTRADADGDIEMEPADPPASVDQSAAAHPVTRIFTLDSLGSQHRKATHVLRQYLQLEAANKKQLREDQMTRASSNYATVPTQPNFCDCGLYLIHFVKTFFSDPNHYTALIKRATRAKVPHAERAREWQADSVAHMREMLAERIDGMSASWRTEREAKRQADEAAAAAAAAATAVPVAADAATAGASAGHVDAAKAPATAPAPAEESDDEIVFTGSVEAPKPPPKAARGRKSAAGTGASKRKGAAKTKTDVSQDEVEVEVDV